ncbi:unnamed protein product [Medioppia subpectinata]|uniref:Calx-beta domain-containing protein n=1 Tax=Medioppia subpectinata TaxID=1979941 RepID=A0A7R9L172_9ACAR|nr:unnamed protein product [Medioppia subpectinata]CAG2113425.1 unnamed protein product [Medioppia subpectinata]
MATKKLTGGNALVKRRVGKTDEKKEEHKDKEDIIKVYFNPAHYTVMENVGQFAVTISREGDVRPTVCVDFKTEDGTANAGSDYEPIEGTIIFRPNEMHKQVFITVIDDDVFEEDEHFYVRLSNPRYLSHDGCTPMNGAISQSNKNPPLLQLATPAIATVMILDDDHSGVYSFAETQYEISESVGEYRLKVNRFSGARGRVSVPYHTCEGTAKDGVEFQMTDGVIFFDNNQTS